MYLDYLLVPLQVEPISQAQARQRSGRAGEGHAHTHAAYIWLLCGSGRTRGPPALLPRHCNPASMLEFKCFQPKPSRLMSSTEPGPNRTSQPAYSAFLKFQLQHICAPPCTPQGERPQARRSGFTLRLPSCSCPPALPLNCCAPT